MSGFFDFGAKNLPRSVTLSNHLQYIYQNHKTIDMDFEFDIEDFENEISEFNTVNGVPYLKKDIKLGKNQAFHVTHLEIREKTGQKAGNRDETNLLDSFGRNRDGESFRSKAERRVKYTNEKHNKDWFLVEIGQIINLID